MKNLRKKVIDVIQNLASIEKKVDKIIAPYLKRDVGIPD